MTGAGASVSGFEPRRPRPGSQLLVAGALIAALGPLRAEVLGAFVHGRAARLWVEAHGGADRGLFARELADSVPRALASLLRG